MNTTNSSTNMSNMSYQAMLLHGQRQTHANVASLSSKQIQSPHMHTSTDKTHTLNSTEKPIKHKLRGTLFHPLERSKWLRDVNRATNADNGDWHRSALNDTL